MPVHDGFRVEYRLIPGFPEYRVGDDGSLWSSHRLGWWPTKHNESKEESPCKWRLMKAATVAGGYLQVNLWQNGKKHNRHVHRLVMLAFRGPCPSGKEVAHVNGRPSDNRLLNLEYKTPVENQADRVRHGTHSRGERCVTAELNEAAVRSIRVAVSRDGVSMSELARRYGVSLRAVQKILAGESWKHVT